MFRITNDVTAPHKARFEAALNRLPDAHREAQHAGVSHLHRKIAEAAESAGLDSSTIGLFHDRSGPYVGIEHTPEGDEVADVEFGHPDKDPRPQPILRTAARAAHYEANSQFAAVLHHRLGL